MSGLTFEGYLDNITQRQLEYIESVIVKLGYNDAKVTVEPVGKVGDNYGAYVRSITVEKNGDTLNMFAKISRGHEKLRETIDIGVYFKNETVIYTEVIPKYTELEIKAGIPESERLTYAKCYGCLNEEPNEVILLEDLKVKGFTMENKCESLSDEAVKLILKNLAALHSLSYVLKAQEPETYKTIISKFTNPWESVQEEDAHYQKMEDGILGVLTDEKYKNHLAGKIFHFTKYMGEINKKRRQCQWAVIIQGDPWTNNFMFQRKDERLVTCCMVDYQLANVNVPASDLGYMIFTCTDHETRMKHYHDWLDYYHSQLTKYLKYHGLEAEQIFSKAQLQEDMKRYGSLSLAQGALVSSIILRESEDAGKMKERIAQAEGEGNVMDTMAEMFKVNQLKEGTVKLFKSRLEGLVDSHLAFGYIE